MDINNEKSMRALEKRLDKILSEQTKDKVTKENKWKPNNLEGLYKKQAKKPEYVLVQYLRNNQRMDFQLQKVVSGNIIVIDNKGHTLNPRLVWRHGKYFWYIVGEWDKEPIGPRYLEKIKKLQRSTDNHPILMKMVLGAIQKKEEIKVKKNLWWIIGIAVAGLILWLILGGKKA
jgi:hypothetical protein